MYVRIRPVSYHLTANGKAVKPFLPVQPSPYLYRDLLEPG